MPHQISIEELSNFEHSSMLASSSKEAKKLVITFTLKDGQIQSTFVVKQYKVPLRGEIKTIYNKSTSSLAEAIEWYNALNETK